MYVVWCSINEFTSQTISVTSRKKLIEIAIPIGAINDASVREKHMRNGHPSTLHTWWSRKPLATCRAMLFAQLVDDPSSHPDRFPSNEAIEAERKRLFKVIEDLVVWENSTNEDVLKRARTEIRKSCGDKIPPVYDPFSGGCSIPLEAQRLGLSAHGSDLNPVAAVVGKAMIEIPSRFKGRPPVHLGGKERTHYRYAEGLAEDVKHYGKWVREQALARIGHLYPRADLPKGKGDGEGTVIAWIWARTVPSPDPAFADVHVPITSSFILSAKREIWVEPIASKADKIIRYRIHYGGDKDKITLAKEGTKSAMYSAHFRCLLSDASITPKWVKEVAISGRMGQELIAIVAAGKRGRIYIEPSSNHRSMAFSEKPKWKPEDPINQDSKKLVSGYGFKFFHELFTARQLVALTTFSDLIHEARSEIERDALNAGFADERTPLRDGGHGARAYAEAASVYLGLVVDKCSGYWSSICTWDSSVEAVRSTFGRQAIPMTWDFVEANPFSASSGNWTTICGRVWEALARFVPGNDGFQRQLDAKTAEFPENAVISTDPPYYDNIYYADLSDFFYCWMKPALRDVYPDLFKTLATPKEEELVAMPHRRGGRKKAEEFFLDGMRKAITNIARQSSSDYPATIYYAFKQSEISQEGVSSTGWATFLQAVIDSGYAIVGTWPMRTEMANRMNALGANTLANSVVLVCRKREKNATIISRAEFISTLKRALPPALEQLQTANISPVDMPQAAIGPGMGVFSRCEKVLESNDNPMSAKTALQLINRELGEYLGGIQDEFDFTTRFAITWFEQHGMEAGEYGDADNLARALGISVEDVRNAGIVKAAAGKVQILGRDDIDPEWDPEKTACPATWACCQQLIRILERDGETAAATLLKKICAQADEAKNLAYCLYDIAANKRQDAGEARAYNGLISAWPELTSLASSADTRGDMQGDLPGSAE